MQVFRSITALFLTATVATQAQSIVDRRGAPRAWGNQILDNAGKPLQLTGMSFFWNQYSEGSAYYTKGTLNWLVDDWKCNVVRLAMGVSATGTYKSANITPMIEAAIAKGVYVIIDWHEEMAVNHVAQSKAFFGQMAKKYGSFPNVIFEIYNEPNGPTWDEISAYAMEVIPAIREFSSNLVIVGTENFSQGVNIAAGAPLDTSAYGNVAYTLHFYANEPAHIVSGRLGSAARSALAARIPLFVTEWGTTSADGGQLTSTSKGAINATESNNWFSLLNKNKISSCNWSICNKEEGASAILPTASVEGGWNDTDLTPSGKYVKALIVSQCTKDPTVCPIAGNQPPAPTHNIPGLIDATQSSLSFGMKTEALPDGAGFQLTSIDSGDWSSYSIRSAAADTYLVRVKVLAPLEPSTLKFTVGTKTVTIPVHPVGGTDSWFWAYSNTTLILPAGDYNGELKIQGIASDLLKIRQIEFVHAASAMRNIPCLVPATEFTSAPTGTTGILQTADQTTPFLSRMRNGATVTYAVNAPSAGTFKLIADVASGSNGGNINVTIASTAIRRGTFAVPPTGGWYAWQSVSKDFEFSEGRNTITLSATADTGALVSISNLRVDDGTPVLSKSGSAGLRLNRSGTGWNLSLGQIGVYTELQLVTAEGRILSRMDVTGLAETHLRAPSTSLPVWIRLKGERSSTLALPPLR